MPQFILNSPQISKKRIVKLDFENIKNNNQDYQEKIPTMSKNLVIQEYKTPYFVHIQRKTDTNLSKKPNIDPNPIKILEHIHKTWNPIPTIEPLQALRTPISKQIPTNTPTSLYRP